LRQDGIAEPMERNPSIRTDAKQRVRSSCAVRSGKQIWGKSIREQTTGAFSFPRRSQYPPKPHECEKSRLTRPRKRITMKSPKDIAKAAFMGAGFRVPFSGGLGYMIHHIQTICNTKLVQINCFVWLHKKQGANMDTTLERILTLIPKKENGAFKHGALSQFARPLGFKDGHIVSDWIAGNSESYKNYLYQISALHGVSVEYLRGETDDPGIKEAPATKGEGEKDALIKAVREITDKDTALAVFDELSKKMRELM
jgi:hypothetical protein